MRRVEAAGTAAPSALAAPLDWLSGCRYNQRQVMHMTIQQILREKGLSRYQLSKRSGIPWATLADICSGKTALTRCSAGTLGKLSAALDIPMEELLTMTVEQRLAPDGKPKDRSYLEKDLPASLQKSPGRIHPGRERPCVLHGLPMGRAVRSYQLQPVEQRHHAGAGGLPESKIPVEGRNDL